jgi:hypothetical protein
MASDEPVQATAMPVSTPDSVSAGTPPANAMTSIAAIYSAAPASSTGRSPSLSATAPTGVCAMPQAMFCAAMPKV